MKHMKICGVVLLAEMLLLVLLWFLPVGFGKKAVTFVSNDPSMHKLTVSDTVLGAAGVEQVQSVLADNEAQQKQAYANADTDTIPIFTYKIVSCDRKLCVVEVQTEYVSAASAGAAEPTAEKQLQAKQTEQIWFFAEAETFRVEVQ